MAELRPCPFCGNRVVYPEWFTDPYGFKAKRVYCPNCTGAGPEVPQAHRREAALDEFATAAWNRRAD